MKIGIASDGNYVSGHFGHCEGFTVYDVENNKVLRKAFVENPGHRPGFLPVFLKDVGINTIIAGGMGESAQELFKEREIEVVVGASGVCEEIIEKYINGQLKSTGSICKEHQHEGHCEE